MTIEMPDGSIELRDVNPSSALATIAIPHFKHAEVLSGERAEGPDMRFIFPPQFKAPKEAMQGVARMGIRLRLNTPRFAQMLAKIGLGVAVAHYGINGFYPLVRDFIRFLPNDYRHWVGGLNTESEKPTRQLHLTLKTEHTSYGGAFIIAYIRLFAEFGYPTNYVVVGKPLAPDKPDRDRERPEET